ncbi:MAG: AMP-binding protein [Pseudomonadota bacterium]
MSEEAAATSSCFWPRGEIEIARERMFATSIALIAERHPHYRRLMSDHGLSAADFGSTADLVKLPVTTKADYMAAPDDFRLDTTGLDEEMRAVWDVMYTTGSTTGQPTPFVSTTFDFYNILTLNRNMMAIRGVRQTDVVANLFPLTRYPHGAFTRAQQAPAVLNIPVVAALPGNPSPHFSHSNKTEEAVLIVERTRATILWGVPSFVRRLLQKAEEMGADFTAVRMVFVTGEALYPAARADLRDRLLRLGAHEPIVSGSYGMTEIQGGLIECIDGSGFHNPLPDQHLIEIVDPDTQEPVRDGEEGIVLLSHLNRRGTVLLRYQVGDLSVMSKAPCPHCGATTDRLVANPRRMDALVKIKGMLVNPDPVTAALAADPDVTHFRLAVEHTDPSDTLSPDVLRLTVAVPSNVADPSARLIDLIKRETGVTPVVGLIDPMTFEAESKSWKEKSFEDRRKMSDVDD